MKRTTMNTWSDCGENVEQITNYSSEFQKNVRVCGGHTEKNKVLNLVSICPTSSIGSNRTNSRPRWEHRTNVFTLNLSPGKHFHFFQYIFIANTSKYPTIIRGVKLWRSQKQKNKFVSDGPHLGSLCNRYLCIFEIMIVVFMLLPVPEHLVITHRDLLWQDHSSVLSKTRGQCSTACNAWSNIKLVNEDPEVRSCDR